MMPRKKRVVIVGIVIAVILAIIIAGLVYVYATTDMFKSDEDLFMKYLAKNVENLDGVYQEILSNQYDAELKQSAHKNEVQAKLNYLEKLGTSAENSSNSMNQITMRIDGQVDNQSQYNYQDIKINKENEKVFELEYLQNEQIHGIKFSDLFQQYVLLQNSDLKQFFKTAGYSDAQINQLPDTITLENKLKELTSFSEEEKEQLSTTYMNIIKNNLGKGSFTSTKNENIEINKKAVSTNTYTVRLTKEQLNAMYVQLLEQLKQDTVLLSKLEQIEKEINIYLILCKTNTLKLKDDLISNIDAKIENITKNNIGQDQVEIKVFENLKSTVRTSIITTENEFRLDYLNVDNEKYIQYKTIGEKGTDNEKQVDIVLINASGKLNLEYVKNEKGVKQEFKFSKVDEKEGSNINQAINFSYENNANRMVGNIAIKNTLLNSVENKLDVAEVDNIKLYELEQEQYNNITERIENEVKQKVDESFNIEDYRNALKGLGIIREEQRIEGTGITEVEKQRFNSQFEILVGQELDNKRAMNMIEAVKDNLVGIEVPTGTVLKLKLDRLNKNEELVQSITEVIEKNSREKYNIKVEYNEETGLIEYMVLEIVPR